MLPIASTTLVVLWGFSSGKWMSIITVGFLVEIIFSWRKLANKQQQHQPQNRLSQQVDQLLKQPSQRLRRLKTTSAKTDSFSMSVVDLVMILVMIHILVTLKALIWQQVYLNYWPKLSLFTEEHDCLGNDINDFKFDAINQMNWQSCIKTCKATEGCGAVTFQGLTCYLKSSCENLISRPNSDLMSASMLDETVQQFILLEQADCPGGDIDGGLAELWVSNYSPTLLFSLQCYLYIELRQTR